MDNNRRNFEDRLRLIERYPGQVARAAGSRRRGLALRKPVEVESALRPLRKIVRIVMVVIAFFAVKAGFAQYAGIDQYDTQVAAMAEGSGWQPLMSVVMERGPVMEWAEPGVAKIMGASGSAYGVASFDWPTFMEVKADTGE